MRHYGEEYGDTDVMTAEALGTRLADLRKEIASLNSYLSLLEHAVGDELWSGAEFVAIGRDVGALEMLVMTSLSQANDVVGVVSREIQRLQNEVIL